MNVICLYASLCGAYPADMKWRRGSGVLARLTFTDLCNKITCFTRHVRKERACVCVRARMSVCRGLKTNEWGCSHLFALQPRYSIDEVLLCRVTTRVLMCSCEEVGVHLWLICDVLWVQKHSKMCFVL